MKFKSINPLDDGDGISWSIEQERDCGRWVSYVFGSKMEGGQLKRIGSPFFCKKDRLSSIDIDCAKYYTRKKFGIG